MVYCLLLALEGEVFRELLVGLADGMGPLEKLVEITWFSYYYRVKYDTFYL
jgi:hypothetical protein